MSISRSLWDAITETYERARAAGAAYKTDTDTELLVDPAYNIEFVLRVATALRDKPKSPRDRQALDCSASLYLHLVKWQHAGVIIRSLCFRLRK